VTNLSGGWNFRDVSHSTDGAVQPGKLFRAGELTKIDDAGLRQLRELRITDVADLRSPPEVERHGSDLVPDGVDVHLLPFLDIVATVDGEAPHEHAFQRLLTEKPDDESVLEAGRRYMADEYRRFAKAPGARRAVQRMVTLLGDGGTVLTHCFAGKDRTGFTVALVLETVGVHRDAIVADFLRSNAAVPELRERILESVRNRAEETTTPEIVTFAEARLNEEVLGVREEYLDAARRAIDAEYGSTAGYLESLGVTSDQVTRLREALVT